MGRVSGNTFRPITLNVQALAGLKLDEFVKELLGQLEHFRAERTAYYENLRRRNSAWANGARALLAILGAIALFSTTRS